MSTIKSGKSNKNECDYMSGNNKCSTRHLHKWQPLPASRCSTSTSTSSPSYWPTPGQSLIHPVNGLQLVNCRKPCSWTLIYGPTMDIMACPVRFIIIIIISSNIIFRGPMVQQIVNCKLWNSLDDSNATWWCPEMAVEKLYSPLGRNAINFN